VGILGAGALGTCIALALARAGIRVVVHAPPPTTAVPSGAWWWAAGMLAPWSEVEECGASLPFLRACAENAASTWRRWLQHEEIAASAGSHRTLHLFSASELARGRRAQQRLVALGAPCSSLELNETTPFLSGGAATFGIEIAQELSIEPRVFLPSSHAALKSLGAQFEVPLRETANHPYHLLIDARGLGAREDWAGLRGVRGEMCIIRLAPAAWPSGTMFRFSHQRGNAYLVPRSHNCWYLGATVVESEAPVVQVRSVLELLATVSAFLPAALHAEVVEVGAGLRPTLPHHRPAARWVPQSRTLRINGLYRHGFLLGPLIAEQVLALLALPEAEYSSCDQWFAES
jgi:glycine oxidase